MRPDTDATPFSFYSDQQASADFDAGDGSATTLGGTDTQFDLINGYIVDIYYGTNGYVPDPINGGLLTFPKSAAPGSYAVRCSFPSGGSPFLCYNTQGTAFDWYKDSNDHVGLALAGAIPTGATQFNAKWLN